VKSLSTALNTAFSAVVQRPAWFLQVDFGAGTERYCSYATTTWNGNSWTQIDFDVSSIRVAPLRIDGYIDFGNADDYIGGKAIGGLFADKRIQIWGSDGSITSPGASDPILLCDGIGAGCEIALDRCRVNIRDWAQYQTGPRATVSPAFGFYTYLPTGKVIRINGVDYEISR
jgi:hypothetical protein